MGMGVMGMVDMVGMEVTAVMGVMAATEAMEATEDTGATGVMAAAMEALAVQFPSEAKASTLNKDSTKVSPDSTADRSRTQCLLLRLALDRCWLTTSPDRERFRSKSISS